MLLQNLLRYSTTKRQQEKTIVGKGSEELDPGPVWHRYSALSGESQDQY
jgi:hypothetical protein